jgi:hypothetical protein
MPAGASQQHDPKKVPDISYDKTAFTCKYLRRVSLVHQKKMQTAYSPLCAPAAAKKLAKDFGDASTAVK